MGHGKILPCLTLNEDYPTQHRSEESDLYAVQNYVKTSEYITNVTVQDQGIPTNMYEGYESEDHDNWDSWDDEIWDSYDEEGTTRYPLNPKDEIQDIYLLRDYPLFSPSTFIATMKNSAIV